LHETDNNNRFCVLNIQFAPDNFSSNNNHWRRCRVVGNLHVDGLYFSGDPSKTIITKPSDFPFPWSILGSDVYYLTGNVGIGTMSPSTKLEVSGTVKATLFSGDGSGLSNVTASSVPDGSITTTKTTTGAVTDTQISGTISAAKLDLSAVQ
jgi:hypothetical protein